MDACVSECTGFPGTQPRICGCVQWRFNHDGPARPDRIAQFKRPWQISAAQHFVTDSAGNHNPPEKLAQQIKFASYRKTDQRTGVGYYEPARHLCMDSVSFWTASTVPETTGMPSLDT